MSAVLNQDLFPLSGARLVPLELIVPGRYQPRKIFDAEKMVELAASVKSSGVMQGILLRPIEGGKLEIVAGERRWRASKMAGVDTIPATIRELTLMQVLELQAIENIQREDLHPLEEAYSFSLLMNPPDNTPGYNIAQIAKHVGKDASHVSRRLVLMRLIPAASDAFLAGHIVLQTAVAIARIPVAIQDKAFPQIMATRSGDAKTVNPRDAMKILEGAFMMRLAQAPFPIKDAKLLPAAGGCNVCPKRTGANPDLFDDVQEADTCVDPQCHGEKVVAWNKLRKAKARKDGIEVIEGKAATALLKFGQASDALNGDYVYMDKPLPELTGNNSPLAKLLGTLLKPSALFEHPREHTLREIVHTHKATQVLKDNSLLMMRPSKGEQTALVAPPAPAWAKTAVKASQADDVLQGRLERERAWRVELFKDVHKALHNHGENVSMVLRRALAMEQALTFLDDADNWTLVSDLWGWKAGRDYRKAAPLRDRLEQLLEPMTATQIDLLLADLIMLLDLEVSPTELDNGLPSALTMAQACDDEDAALGIEWRTYRMNGLAEPKLKKKQENKTIGELATDLKAASRARQTPPTPTISPPPAKGVKGAATKAEAGKPATKAPEDISQAPPAQTKKEGSDLPHWVGQMVKVKGHKPVGEIRELNADGSLLVAFPNGQGEDRLHSVLRSDTTALPGQPQPQRFERGQHVRVISTGKQGVVLEQADDMQVRVELQVKLGPVSGWPFPDGVKTYPACDLTLITATASKGSK